MSEHDGLDYPTGKPSAGPSDGELFRRLLRITSTNLTITTAAARSLVLRQILQEESRLFIMGNKSPRS